MTKSPLVRTLEDLTDNKCDPTLGSEIHTYLVNQGLETPFDQEQYDPGMAYIEAKRGIKNVMVNLGLDLTNPSLEGTPDRFARMFVGDLTQGLCYDLFPKCTTVPAESEDMVLVRDIQLISLCEHHFQTIDGVVHIAYIPSMKWLGLSKFARIVEFFGRRPQVQERLTAQIYHALCYILNTVDVAVIVDARHYCMKARGVLQHATMTQTDKMGGRFFTKPELRGELLNAIYASRR